MLVAQREGERGGKRETDAHGIFGESPANVFAFVTCGALRFSECVCMRVCDSVCVRV